MITSFRGDNFFLSNFYPCKIEYKGLIYNSSEHAYMSEKTNDSEIKKFISESDNPAFIKKYCSKDNKNFKIVDNWENIKYSIMSEVLTIKFSNKELNDKLQKTYPEKLIELNNWGDVYWGQCPLGKGKNMLGEILMRIRNENRFWE